MTRRLNTARKQSMIRRKNIVGTMIMKQNNTMNKDRLTMKTAVKVLSPVGLLLQEEVQL